MVDRLELQKLLIAQEGLRLKPYKDSIGKITIGVGRCLDDVGINSSEAMVLLNTDIDRVINEAKTFKWFDSLSSNRQNAISCMMFNLGLGGFLNFKKLISALEISDFKTASYEMISSKWAAQVGERAKDLSKMVLEG